MYLRAEYGPVRTGTGRRRTPPDGGTRPVAPAPAAQEAPAGQDVAQEAGLAPGRHHRPPGCWRCWRVLVTAFAFVMYSVAHVPSPDELQTNQTATLMYADGSTMASITGGENRTIVPLSKVPVHVRDAVIAAEDRGFYSEPGISIRGTVRAAVNDLKGGNTQGGSTITQQYVKNAYLNSDQTLSRKLKELAISLKLSREYSKDDILQNYLNTIYFGRQAYGIEAAAKAYFGVDVSKLTVAQGALLAAVIKSPEYYDPRGHPERGQGPLGLRRRRHGQHRQAHPGPARRAEVPDHDQARRRSASALDGPLGLVWRQVKAELSADGIDPADHQHQGPADHHHHRPDGPGRGRRTRSARRTPTCSRSRRTCGRRWPRSTRTPAAVLAYYGGKNGTGLDYVQSWRPPGSTFKPYVTATALTQNLQGKKPAYTIQSVFDGSSPQYDRAVPDLRTTRPTRATARTPLKQATTLSLNTVFAQADLRLVGPANVVKMARAMGIPATESDTGPNPGAPTLMRNGVADDYVGHRQLPGPDPGPGGRLRHPGRRRAVPAGLLHREGHRRQGQRALPAQGRRQAGDGPQGRQRHHAGHGAGRRRPRASGWTTAGPSRPRPAPCGIRDDRRLHRRLDGRLHPAGGGRVLGRLGQGRADLRTPTATPSTAGTWPARPGRSS